MITVFKDWSNCSWLASVAGTDEELKQVDENMLDVFFSTLTLILIMFRNRPLFCDVLNDVYIKAD